MFGSNRGKIVNRTSLPRRVTLGKAEYRIVRKDKDWWTFSYLVEINNRSGDALAMDYMSIKFLDKKGFAISENVASIDSIIDNKSKHKITGLADMEAAIGKQVSKAEIRFA